MFHINMKHATILQTMISILVLSSGTTYTPSTPSQVWSCPMDQCQALRIPFGTPTNDWSQLTIPLAILMQILLVWWFSSGLSLRSLVWWVSQSNLGWQMMANDSQQDSKTEHSLSAVERYVPSSLKKTGAKMLGRWGKANTNEENLKDPIIHSTPFISIQSMTLPWKFQKKHISCFKKSIPGSLPHKQTSPEVPDHGDGLTPALSTFPYLRLCAMVELNSTTSCRT